MPKAEVSEGWVQKAKDRLYSLRNDSRDVSSRRKNLRAIGVPRFHAKFGGIMEILSKGKEEGSSMQ